MPRLSIIVPHRNDDLRLEETLVSVLENRPNDCEILVAHDGSYRDKYALSDEVVFVQTEAGSNLLRKVNEAVLASCAPTVHLVMDGVRVSDRWCETPLDYFADPRVGAVSPVIETEQSARTVVTGLCLDSTGLRRCVARTKLPPGGQASHRTYPSLTCGFYRRRVLLALNGWLESVESTIADVDLALALHSLGLQCRVDLESRACAPRDLVEQVLSAKAVRQLATLGVAYRQIDPGLGNAFRGSLWQLIHGRLLPQSWLNAAAWGFGIFDRRFACAIGNRLQAASKRLSTQSDPALPDTTSRKATGLAPESASRHGALRKAA